MQKSDIDIGEVYGTSGGTSLVGGCELPLDLNVFPNTSSRLPI